MIQQTPEERIGREQLVQGRYRIRRVLGEGASATVFLAEDEQLHNQPIALKFLHAQLVFSEESFGRFRNETRVTMSLNHPHILQTYGMGRAPEQGIFLKMEYLEGYSLEEALLQNGKYALEDAILILRDIASALEYAHRSGVIHRDLKPANIMLDPDGRPKVADFGLAQMIRLEARYTGYGDILGTPYYMSPEQLRSESLDARSDMYSFGILAYELLANQKPFEADSFLELAEQHFGAELPAIDAPDWLQELIRRCAAKDRLDRYPSMLEVLNTLDLHCDVEAISQKSSRSRVPQQLNNAAALSEQATHLRVFGLNIHRNNFIGLGKIRLKIWLVFLIISLTVPTWNRPSRWRYAAATLMVEKVIGFELVPLRLLFFTPLDLRYPDSLFIDPDKIASYQNIRMVYRPLFLAGYDPNVINPKSNTYPFNDLIINSHSNQLEWFLHYGADPNLLDPQNMTTLDYAVRSLLDIRTLNLLIDNGANPNRVHRTITPPLAHVLSSGRTDVAKILISRGGARGDIPSRLELPILHLAIKTVDQEVVQMLLDRGVSPLVTDEQGRTAIEFAKKQRDLHGMDKIIELLEAAIIEQSKGS